MKIHAAGITRRLLLASALLLALPGALLAQGAEPEEGFQYDRIQPPVPPKGSKPEITEVFNFKCPHCFHLHPALAQWRKKHEAQYSFPSLPIIWGQQTDAPLRAFFAAEFLGKGEAMKDAIFKANFDRKMNIENEAELSTLAKEVGLEETKFREVMRSFGISGRVAQSRALAKAYGTTSTPNLVINGKFRVTPDHAGGDWNKMLEIAERLTTR